MRIAIPTFDGLVAPRAEGAPELYIFEVEEPGEEPHVVPGLVAGLGAWLDLLEKWGVEWVLCGGMSPFLLTALAARGIRAMTGVAGDVEGVVEALRSGRLTVGAAAPFSPWPARRLGRGRRYGLGPFRPKGSRRGRGRRTGPFGKPGRAGRPQPGENQA